MREKGRTGKEGAALLIAVVIMMITVALSLSLLLVSGSLYGTLTRQSQMRQCRELAQTLSRAIESELTSTPHFKSFEEQKAALDKGDYLLYFYLRYNVGQTSWPYYNSDEYGHTARAMRKFEINVPSELGASVTVTMYWEGEKLDYGSSWEENCEDTPLVIQVECTMGRQRSVDTSTYTLAVTKYAEANEESDDPDGAGPEEERDNTSNKEVNPDGNSISKAYYWSWGVPDRE